MKRKTYFAVLLLLMASLTGYGNLVQNPSMEEGFMGGIAKYWTAWGNASFSPGGYVHDGGSSQGIATDRWGHEYFSNGIYQITSSLQMGQAYRISSWFKSRFSHWGNYGALGCAYFVEIDLNGGPDHNIYTYYGVVSYWNPSVPPGELDVAWTNVVTFLCPNNPSVTIFLDVFTEASSFWLIGPPEEPFEVIPEHWYVEHYLDDVSLDPVEIGQQSRIEATSPVLADGVNYSEITVTVLYPNGNPIEGIPVSEIIVNCTGNGNTIIDPGWGAYTNAYGQITQRITSTVAETKTVTVTVLGTPLSDTATIEFTPDWAVLTVQTSPSDFDTVDPLVGDHQYASGAEVALSASRFVDCPNVYVFDHWEGDVNDVNSPETTILMDDDKTVTAVFVDGRECGDECHPYPVGDINQDCIFDFRDIATMCLHWLECTKPECD